MTQLAHAACIKAEALSHARFIGLSAMRLINAMTVASGDLSNIPRGRKTSERKYAKKIMRDAIKYNMTIEKPYQIRELDDGRKGLFVLGYDGIYFAM